MLKNFFKVAIRNLVRHKGFSFLNIAGLALGLTTCILIGLFVWDENQFDKFLPGSDRVYRIYNEHTDTEGTENMAVTPPMYATTLRHDFPEVEQTARVMMSAEYKMLFEKGNTKLYESSGYFVDSTFFELFPVPLKYGSLSHALDHPSSIVISDEMAERFFENENPVGKEILMNKTAYQVKAVFQKNPKFHLQFNFIIPLAAVGLPADRMERWGWQQFFTYLKLRKNADAKALESKFQHAVKQKARLFSGEEYEYKPFLQPLKNIHLYSANFKFDNAQRGNIAYVNALTIIAIFIISIACFNFVNLATAKSLQRAKEVGVRKAIGAEKKHLMAQFIGETVLLTFISILISVGLAAIFLPWLNDFTGKQITFQLFANPVLILLLLGLTLVVGILAGFYPALVLSGFKPVKVLKGTTSGAEEAGKTPWLRHGLVVTQFALSILLIISAITVYNQVNYLHSKDLGFNKEQIMFFPMRGDSMQAKVDAFKEQLLQSPGVSSVSIGYGFPGDAVAGDEIIVPRNGERVTHSATQLMVDYDYVKTLGLKLVAGRDFSKARGTDKDHAWIINETAVKQLGFQTPEKALGQTLAWHPWGASNPDSLKTGQVVGVVRDFNYKSLYDKMETAVLQIFPDAAWKVAVKMKTANINNSIQAVTNVWNRFTPDYPIEYKFLDDNFEQMYLSEDKLKSLLWIFTSIAVFVGCLGLLGLAAYSAERRIKEVGIRKVLGASVTGVVVLLSKDFIKLVVISLLIASPLAYYLMHRWLEDFAYRINISWWIFAVAAVTAVGIAFVTVGSQAIRSATNNPVKSLRME
jgi:putative ABC transport system permease protein